MFVEFQKELGEVAEGVQELCISSTVLGLRRVKWELTSQLRVRPSVQLEVICVVIMCTFILLVLMYMVSEHLYLNKDMSLTLSH